MPATAQATPPAEHILVVISRILDQLNTESGEAESVLKIAETVVEIVKMRLTSGPVEDLTQMLQTFDRVLERLAQVCGQLMAKIPALMTRILDILNARERLKTLKLQLKELANVPIVGIQREPEGGRTEWANATVAWLAKAPWLRAPELALSYETSDQYAETLLQLWTMLTFYWGATALHPKCMFKTRDFPCGQPLFADPEGGSCYYCHASSVAVACPNKRHGFGVCSRCFNNVQRALLGPPGPGASTDVYDARVQRESIRSDGDCLVLSGVKSRKPPTVATNWSTSYRLGCAALVAIVRLEASHEALPLNRKIQWAEIVDVDSKAKREEPRNRANGIMAVKLLSGVDCSSLPLGHDNNLRAGSLVAVIDLRVFVPEVVSVLGTFCEPRDRKSVV